MDDSQVEAATHDNDDMDENGIKIIDIFVEEARDVKRHTKILAIMAR